MQKLTQTTQNQALLLVKLQYHTLWSGEHKNEIRILTHTPGSHLFLRSQETGHRRRRRRGGGVTKTTHLKQQQKKVGSKTNAPKKLISIFARRRNHNACALRFFFFHFFLLFLFVLDLSRTILRAWLSVFLFFACSVADQITIW